MHIIIVALIKALFNKITIKNEVLSTGSRFQLYSSHDLNLVKCNLTKLTTTSLAVKRFTSLAVKRFSSLAVKRFSSLAV